MTGPAFQRYMGTFSYFSDVKDHLPLLYRYSRGHVLELGVRGGVSTAALLAGVEERGGHLWSIDIDPDCRNIWARGHPQWTFIHGNSCEFVAGGPDSFEVLFIDTSHTYEQTLCELELWGAKSMRIFLHDANDDTPGVERAVTEWCARTRRSWRIRQGSHGLAIIGPAR
jgi:cephalosporin hydroxylase